MKALLKIVQKDAPWVVAISHDPFLHVVKLYDSSGDWRQFPCVAFWRTTA